MGSGYILLCPICAYELEILLGVGMLYSSLENVVDQLHPSCRGTVRDILKNHSVRKTDFWMALYRCEKCNRLYNRLYARIEYDEGQVYETLYKCPKCKLALNSVPDNFDLTTAPCPSCGKSRLEIRGHIDWD